MPSTDPTTVTWVLPLVLMPAVALLLISTSARIQMMHNEVHHLLTHNYSVSGQFIAHLRARARQYRNALVGFYAAVTLFAFGSILGAFADLMGLSSAVVVIAFTVLGIISLILSAVQLIQESTLSLEAVEEHLDDIEQQLKDGAA
ncbi:MAG: DUF2721 domain-containing protein [Chloroflexi bacterium]|nr:DUF2721 domain-containing protein [Chloroflexota bacterium]